MNIAKLIGCNPWAWVVFFIQNRDIYYLKFNKLNAENAMGKYRIDFKAADWQSPVKGMRQKIYKYGPKQLRLVEYTRDLPPHWCEKGHVGYVLQGQMEIEFARESQIYSSGDGIFIPDGPEHKHKGRVISETVTIVFVEDV